MTKGVITVKEDEDLRGVAEVMSYYKISSVIVVDKEKRPVGVLTETDMTRALIKGDASDKKAKEVMCRQIFTVDRDATVRDVARLMRENRIHRVFIVSKETGIGRVPMGVVAISDIIRELAVSR
jgi:CBS domain-containing protein